MIKSWRPEGWKTPNFQALKDVKVGWVMKDQVRFLTPAEVEAYEAGADAMLGALRAEGRDVHEYYLNAKTPGTMVFIPDEEVIV